MAREESLTAEKFVSVLSPQKRAQKEARCHPMDIGISETVWRRME